MTSHIEKNTFTVDINLPGKGGERTTTALFERSRKTLIQQQKGRCWICGQTEEEVGHPIEAHHYPIERCLTDMIDWSPDSDIRKDFPAFSWEAFSVGATWEHVEAAIDPESGETVPAYDIYRPVDPYQFVDNMLINGRLLCKYHHIGKDTGVHTLPEPIWLAQRYGREGYDFSKVEIIHHSHEVKNGS